MVKSRKKRPTRGLRARAWWVLRKNKAMTIVEIQSTVCHGHERSAESNLRRWFAALLKAGVVTATKVDDGIPTSNGSNCYRLVIDLGPKPPVVRANGGEIFDPNSDEVFWRARHDG